MFSFQVRKKIHLAKKAQEPQKFLIIQKIHIVKYFLKIIIYAQILNYFSSHKIPFICSGQQSECVFSHSCLLSGCSEFCSQPRKKMNKHDIDKAAVIEEFRGKRTIHPVVK